MGRYYYGKQKAREWLLYGLIFLTVGVTCFVWYVPFYKGVLVYNRLKVMKYGEWYRFFTCVFLHGDMRHLAFNMLGLYSFGRSLVWWWSLGRGGFCVLYLGGAVFAGWFSHVYDGMYGTYDNVISLGASGGVCAVMMASILVTSDQWVFMMGVPMPSWVFGLGFSLYTFYSMNSMDGIGHSAHFGGLLYGGLFVLCLDPRVFLGYYRRLQRWFSRGF